MKKYQIVEYPNGTWRCQVLEPKRFLWWSWTSIYWGGTNGHISDTETSKVALKKCVDIWNQEEINKEQFKGEFKVIYPISEEQNEKDS